MDLLLDIEAPNGSTPQGNGRLPPYRLLVFPCYSLFSGDDSHDDFRYACLQQLIFELKQYLLGLPLINMYFHLTR